MSTARALVELVRAPAALTVVGDTLVGAAHAGYPLRGRTALLPVASTCLYWAGMALNDYADRDLDAVERPERPIPSGRVRPEQAALVAAGLTTAGVTLAVTAGGARGAALVLPLAASAWAYDLALKDGPLGVPAMASARGLDVLMGAGGRRAGWLPAAAVAAHVVGVTTLSRGEVHGTTRGPVVTALAGTAAAAAASLSGPRRSKTSAVSAAAMAMAYATQVGSAQAGAWRRPDAGTVRAATGTGLRGLLPLQAALAARAGAVPLAAGLALIGPIARRAAKRVSST